MTTPTLAQQVAWLFPSAVPNVDYLVMTDDTGQQYIASWSYAGAPQPTASQLAAAQAPFVPATMSFLQFMTLFSAAEQDAIFASNDTQTKMFVVMAAAAGSSGLQLANSEVISGVNYLATPATASPPGPGLITAARAQQILAGQAPPSS